MSDSIPAAAVFQFHLPGSGLLEDELGVWSASPANRAAAASFSGAATTAPGSEGVFFRAALPAQPQHARRSLDLLGTRLARAGGGLDDASARLERFAAGGYFQVGAFSAPAAPGAPPEADLVAWVWAARGVGSFAPYGAGAQNISAAAKEAAACLERARRLLSGDSLVETRSGGQRLGLTLLPIGGDLSTAWGTRLDSEAIALHNALLEHAVCTRRAWLKMAALLARGALQLAVLFPTAPLLALPAAYRFIRQVIHQIQTFPEPGTPAVAGERLGTP